MFEFDFEIVYVVEIEKSKENSIVLIDTQGMSSYDTTE